jgi:hypothetical protein
MPFWLRENTRLGRALAALFRFTIGRCAFLGSVQGVEVGFITERSIARASEAIRRQFSKKATLRSLWQKGRAAGKWALE